MADIDVRDNPHRSRYEAHAGDTLIGFVAYQATTELRVLTHTEVDQGHEGQGVGSAMARAALDDIGRRSMKALVICPFITGWISHHPEYVPVLYGAPPSNVTD